MNYRKMTRTTFNSLPNEYSGVLVSRDGGSKDEPIGITGGMNLCTTEQS